MKISKGLAAILLATTATAANASTVFTATDGDVNFLFDSGLSSYELAMFDDDDLSFSGTALFIDPPEIVGIAGPNGAGDHIATNEFAETLVLTDSPSFILGISSDGGVSWLADSGATSVGANSYVVSFLDGDGSVLTVDVEITDVPTIPIPAAVWLFGTGLIGLVAVARRRA